MTEQAEDEPWIWIIAGPNGAGKTTLATQTVRDEFLLRHFINTDEIARLLSPNAPNAALMQSGRLMLNEFDRLRAARISFAVETTLSSVSYLHKAVKMKHEGWWIGLLYVWLESVELSQARVLQRVRKGGHDVPPRDIQRRYGRSLKNLPNYLAICDRFLMFNNSGATPDLIAEGWGGGLDVIWDDDIVGRVLSDAYQPFADDDR